MNTPIHDAINAIEHPFNAFHRHHDQAAATAGKDTPMILTDVKNIITALEANPLIAAMAEHNLGTILSPAEVTAVAAFVRALEDAKRPQAAPMLPTEIAPLRASPASPQPITGAA